MMYVALFEIILASYFGYMKIPREWCVKLSACNVSRIVPYRYGNEWIVHIM